MLALHRFVDVYTMEHEKLLQLARSSSPATTVKGLLNSGDKTALEYLQNQLDELEVLSTGARMQIYDVNVIYQVARSMILQLWERSTNYRADLRTGKSDTRPAQGSAYEHCKWLAGELSAKLEGGPVQLDGTLPPIG